MGDKLDALEKLIRREMEQARFYAENKDDIEAMHRSGFVTPWHPAMIANRKALEREERIAYCKKIGAWQF
jgi:outer membrane protein assembly factor BamD (BamD/ComL family)